MKHLVATVALACALVTTGCIAGTDPGSGEADDSRGMAVAGGIVAAMKAGAFDATSNNLTGANYLRQPVTVKHLPSTHDGFASDPNEYPPGTCRTVAAQWNDAGAGRGSASISDLLGMAAAGGCRFIYNRSASQNADGSFDLNEIRPSF